MGPFPPRQLASQQEIGDPRLRPHPPPHPHQEGKGVVVHPLGLHQTTGSLLGIHSTPRPLTPTASYTQEMLTRYCGLGSCLPTSTQPLSEQNRSLST